MRRGYTLLELILVMMLIVLVAGIVAPRFSDFFPALQVDRSARTVLAWARKARADAALTGARQRFVLDVENRVYWIESQADPLREPNRFERATGVWREEALPDRVQFGRIEGMKENGNRRLLEFLPDGTAADAGIEVRNEAGDRREIRITAATGDVSVVEEER